MSVHAQGGPTLPPWYRASIKNKRERGCQDFKKRERERERKRDRKRAWHQIVLVPEEWTWSVCCRIELTWHILAPAGMVVTREIDLKTGVEGLTYD
jgi:hypothetical protein